MPRNVEDDFLQAYLRITSQSPSHPKLKARTAAGDVLVPNQSNVAMEAGHSRTLISQRAKGYERICALLYPEESNANTIVRPEVRDRPETPTGKIERLNAENKALERERDQFATRLAEAYLAIQLKDRQLASLQAEISRRSRNDASFDTGPDI
ncbi:hypothetical protein [Rhizobium binxianense]|uniref:hypothetical protein n=1 Tax=Rhizobium binxianense TaxID=3024242 RepID=UPI0023A9583F|nr:hypothetical protein [Rhizobium sp. MJ22]WEA26930.1 hypothetical protein PO862_06235 [Rhizobium sp. MJ22]